MLAKGIQGSSKPLALVVRRLYSHCPTSCHKVPQVATRCHKVPQVATRCHKVPQVATSFSLVQIQIQIQIQIQQMCYVSLAATGGLLHRRLLSRIISLNLQTSSFGQVQRVVFIWTVSKKSTESTSPPQSLQSLLPVTKSSQTCAATCYQISGQ